MNRTMRRSFFVVVAATLLGTYSDEKAAHTITINDRQISTGSVYELESLISSTHAVDEFYTIIESYTVFIDFYAPWCRPCQTMSPRFKELAKESDHVLFITINTDIFRTFAHMLGVKSLPTFISFRSGEEVSRIKGNVSKKQLKIASGIC